MVHKICKVVLLSLLLMALLSPLLQLNSCDRFPASGDIEAEITYCLCSLGMVLVLTGVLRLIPELSRALIPLLLPQFCAQAFLMPDEKSLQRGPVLLLVPLRI
jgi:hypothetical protein